MTDLVLLIITGCTVLVIIGALIGHSLSEHLRDQQVRRQAAAQRRIAEEWRLLREERARPRTGRCRRCSGPCAGPDQPPSA